MSADEELDERPGPCEFRAADVAAVKVFPGNNTVEGPLQCLMREAQNVVTGEVWDVLVVVRDSTGRLRYEFQGDGTPTTPTGGGGATMNVYRGTIRGGPVKSKPIILKR